MKKKTTRKPRKRKIKSLRPKRLKKHPGRKRRKHVWRKHVKRHIKKRQRRKVRRKVTDWKEVITHALEKVKSDLLRKEKIESGAVRVARNADESVDGEIRIPVPIGMHERKVAFALYRVVHARGLPERVWYAAGGRYTVDTPISQEDRDRYLLYFGLIDTALAYYRGTRYAAYFVDVLGAIDAMRQAWQRKAVEIVFRLHWNAQDEQPSRKGNRGGKRGKK